MRLTGLIVLSVLLHACSTDPDTKSDSSTSSLPTEPYIVVLGIAQDGGYPHIGCERECCQNVDHPQRVSCIGLIDPTSGHKWIFDATPDMPSQIRYLDRLNSKRPLVDGVFPTHAHIGHYTGLMYLGREALGADKIMVYAMPRMKLFLEGNGPWDQLVNLGNIELTGMYDNDTVRLTRDILVIPFTVPHRDEYSETVGFRIVYGASSVVYLPDIDKWETWKGNLTEMIGENDMVFIDGTFYRNGEIPGSDMSQIPHPFMEETISKLENLDSNLRNRVKFIHFNHTNPAIHSREKTEKELTQKGFGLAYDGMIVPLSGKTETNN